MWFWLKKITQRRSITQSIQYNRWKREFLIQCGKKFNYILWESTISFGLAKRYIRKSRSFTYPDRPKVPYHNYFLRSANVRRHCAWSDNFTILVLTATYKHTYRSILLLRQNTIQTGFWYPQPLLSCRNRQTSIFSSTIDHIFTWPHEHNLKSSYYSLDLDVTIYRLNSLQLYEKELDNDQMY